MTDKIKSIIASTLNIPLAEVTDDLSVGDIPQWDSMGNMAIIAAIEELFGIEIPLEDLFDLNSVESIKSEISKLVKE